MPCSLKYLLLFLILSNHILAGSRDGLKENLPLTTVKERVDSLNQLVDQASIEKGLSIAKEAYNLAKKENYPLGQAAALSRLGSLHYREGRALDAILSYETARHFFEQSGNTEGHIKALQGLLSCEHNLMQNQEKSLKYAMEIEAIAENNNHPIALGHVYTHYARVYGEATDNFPLARHYLFQAIDLFGKHQLPEQMPMIYNDLALTYKEELNFDSAYYYFNEGLAIAKSLKNKNAHQTLLINFGSTSLAANHTDTALNYTQKALKLAEELQDPSKITFANLLISQSYFDKQNFSEALNFAKKGENLAEKTQKLENIEFSYEQLRNIFKKIGNLDKALMYAEKLEKVKDRIYKQETFSKISEISGYYQLYQKEKELVALEKDAYSQRMYRNRIIAILALLSLLLYFIFIRYRLKNKIQKHALEKLQIQTKLQEKEQRRLRDELAFKERSLATNTMHIIQKNEFLTHLKSDIEGISTTQSKEELKKRLRNINNSINLKMNFDDDWEKFKLHFQQVHPHFFEKIRQNFKNLSNNDIRFCAYIRMGLSTKEIAQLQGISASSIQKARYRLKKKIGLAKEINLVDFISNF